MDFKSRVGLLSLTFLMTESFCFASDKSKQNKIYLNAKDKRD